LVVLELKNPKKKIANLFRLLGYGEFKFFIWQFWILVLDFNFIFIFLVFGLVVLRIMVMV
jgi:hypothetical protein